MSFDEVARIGRCEVCEAQDVPVVVVASALGPCSFSYCKHCYQEGLEPYYACVAAVWSAGKWPDDIGSGYQDMIRRVLKLKGISEEQFQQDIAALDADYSPSVAEKEEGTDDGSETSEHS